MKRKGGFTLVELLIVIMIIGILAGMVLLSMGPVLDNARASNVINDLRVVLSAARLNLVDGMKYPGPDEVTAIESLMNKKLVATDKYVTIVFGGPITIGEGATATTEYQYVGLQLNGAYAAKGVIDSLAKKEKEIGIVGGGEHTANIVSLNAAAGTPPKTIAFPGTVSILLPMRQGTATP